MANKSTDITERHPPEVRVRVKANFTGYAHPFGITVEQGEEYELSKVEIEKMNRKLKVKNGGGKPFTIIGDPTGKPVGKFLRKPVEEKKQIEPAGNIRSGTSLEEEDLEEKEEDLKEDEPKGKTKKDK